jgi:hypothetical protein
MKEGIINFETAVLAKEKGFDEECSYCYGSPSTNFDYPKELTGRRSWNSVTLTKFISAPTQSLLQRWLREVHNIDMYIRFWDDSKTTYESIFRYIDKNKKNNTIFKSTFYESYEEALEACLFEALKVI